MASWPTAGTSATSPRCGCGDSPTAWWGQGAGSGEYDEKTSSAAGSIQKQLFSRRLILSLGGSYSRLDGLVVNDAYSITGSASWKLGRLDLTLGASVFDTETEGPLLIASRRSHQYYYLKLRRQLF